MEDTYVSDEATEPNPLMQNVGTHLRKEDFHRVNSVILDIEFVGTPAKFDKMGTPVWKLESEQVLKTFKDNVAQTDRDKASDEHLQGDLKYCIPIDLKVMEVANSAPFKVGIDVPGILGKTVTNKKTFVHTIPANTAPTILGQPLSVFEPVNPVDKPKFLKMAQSNLGDLEKSLQLVTNHKNGAHAKIEVGSLPFRTLRDNVDLWPEVAETIDFDNVRTADIEVPLKVGQHLQEFLKPQVAELEKAYMNVENIQANLFRADGEKFSSSKNIVGTTNSQNLGAEVSHAMNNAHADKVMSVHLKAEFFYCLQ